MPDTPSSGGSKNNFGFLTRKLGPAPLWLWAALAVGAYYLYTKYKGGSSSATTDPSQTIDPATGITYAQELSDAQDQITQLQAQINAQGQGQVAPTTINVTQTETEPGSGTPVPQTVPGPVPATRITPPPATTPPTAKPPAAKPEKKIPVVTGNPADRALSTIEAAGFEAHTNPYRDPSKTYTATGTTPSGQAPEGSTVVVNVKENAAKTTTKAKATAKPKRTAATTLKSVPAVKKAA